MKPNKEHTNGNQKVYNLSQLTSKVTEIKQYTSLISMLHSQIDLYKKTIVQLNDALQLYHQTISNLASFFEISSLQGQIKDGDFEKLKIWLSSVEECIVNTAKTNPKEIEKIVQIQKLVEVEMPVFIERTIEVDRPITVIQEIQREVEKPIYIQKTVEVPVFVEKNQNKLCMKCSNFV